MKQDCLNGSKSAGSGWTQVIYYLFIKSYNVQHICAAVIKARDSYVYETYS